MADNQAAGSDRPGKAARGDDREPEASAEVFRRQYVVPPGIYGETFDHAPNAEAIRQDAVNAGLRPTGPGAFTGQQAHPDGESTVLTYAIPVVSVRRRPVEDDGAAS